MSTLRFLTISCALLAAAGLSHADIITDWNDAALQAIRIDKTPPPKAARALAMLHTAMFDAVNGISQTHERYLVPGKPAPGASAPAAASAAALSVLALLFPEQQAAFAAAHQKSLAAIGNAVARDAGVAWGQSVAAVILGARLHDGADRTVPYVARLDPGAWQPTPPALAPPLLPQWVDVTCFAMTSASQFRPPKPPALTSTVYAFDFELTKELGSKDSTKRNVEQTAVAQFWADGPGSVTPPGHWNAIARDLAIQRKLSLEDNARLFALLNIALADAAICCWDCKYVANFWRPITAIHNAESDGNPATEQDPAWAPLLVTPPFPEYTSGHSTFSSAAATVLAAFFGTDNVRFTTTSDALPGFSRSFTSFSEAAAEAGMSRIFGGIHFMSANQQGLAAGNRLGTYVAENFLRPKPAAPAAPKPAGTVAQPASKGDRLAEATRR